MGALYARFLRLHERCPCCEVRFERWAGTWTVPAVMGNGAGVLFAAVLGSELLRLGKLRGSEGVIIPATVAFTVALYPLCKSASVFLLWKTGFVTVDPPRLLREEEKD
ncbi:MAG: hypothetical protein ACOZNI_31975 [Myxococcota bacterium]